MKKLIGLCLGLVALAIPTVANAATTLPEAVDGKVTLTEDVTLDASYIVRSGENITLDLAGHTIKTSTGLAADTIYVENGATLKIVGDGTILNSYNADNYAALFNNGTVTLDGVKLTLDKSVNNNTYYVVLNHGAMTIENANITSNDSGSSLFDNGYASFASSNERSGYVEGKGILKPTLTINNGVFDGGMNTIKNDDNATLVINDGTFKNNVQVAVMNWNIATINGGTFETPTGNDKTNLFVSSDTTNVDRKTGSNEVLNAGKLVINGGVFNAEHLLEGYNGVTTPVEINGGTLNYTQSFYNEDPTKTPAASIASGTEIKGDVTAPKSALVYAKSGATVELTDAVVDDVLNVAEGVTVTIAGDGDLSVKTNEDGSLTVVESADLTKLVAVLEKILDLDEKAYTEESLAALEEVILKNEAILNDPNLGALGQDTIDALTSELEKAVAALVEVHLGDVNNPDTSDNILGYMTLCFVSMLGLGFTVKQKRFN